MRKIVTICLIFSLSLFLMAGTTFFGCTSTADLTSTDVTTKEGGVEMEEAAEEPEEEAEEETEAAEEAMEEEGGMEWVNATLYPSLEVPVLADKKIYYVESFLGDVAHAMMVSGAESIFADMQVDYEVLNPENDLQRQIAMIDDIIAKGDGDALLLSAIDSEGISASVEKCNENDLPVFIIDRWSTGGDVVFGVGGDWYMHGSTCTNQLVNLLTEKNGNPEGKVIAMIVGMEINALRDRAVAFRDIIAEYPDIEVLEKQASFDPNDCAKVLQDALTANPDTEAIWNIADYFGQSYVPALEEIDSLYPVGDPNHIILCSMDGTDWALQAIRDGYFDSTVSSYLIEWGYLAAWAAGQYLGGKADFSGELVVEGASWSGKYFDMGNGTFLGLTSELVTIDNVDDPTLWGNRVDEFLE